MEIDRLDSALQELIVEQHKLTAVRSDYARIIRSRFHALRMLWFSLKQALGIGARRDIFATWSTALTVSVSPIHPMPATRGAWEATASFSDEQNAFFARWRERLSQRPLACEPLVSVIIPVYNHLDVTMRCLQSIADSWFDSLAVQIIVVDDASSDPIAETAHGLPGLDFIRSGVNQGFVRSCNRGAALARGKYLCFLNNDTTVCEGWLDYLVSRAESDARIGVVGAKLVYPDGKLQEAGGIIWQDGTGWNYGRGDDPADSRYNYVRDVDYCSGAALLVRNDLFKTVGGFSETFVPAYYEDVDLCFEARARGFRVVYEPRSEIVHYEGLSSGTDTFTGIKKFQTVNLPKFRAKWRDELESNLGPHADNVPEGSRRLRVGQVVLVVDSHVPMHDKDAGSMRLYRVIKMMRDLGYSVIFLPDNYAALQPYTAELQALGVEVLHHHHGGRPMEAALNEVLPLVDVAWICRPQLFEKYAPMFRRNRATKIVYDMIDLHFMREKRESELLQNGSQSWKATEKVEIDSAKSADATVVVSHDEQLVLENYGITQIAVIPTIHEVECTDVPGFEARSGVLFIGGYSHTPNIDAVKWLSAEIMPLVWKKIPDARLTLLGSNPPPDVLALESDLVRVPGYIHDVGPYFLRHRVFVAPMRFGAGLKGKIGQSIGYGLPVVTTRIGAEGFGLVDGVNVLLAEDSVACAEAIAALYADQVLWERVSGESIRAVAPFTSAATAPKLRSLLNGLLTRCPVAQ